MWKIWLIASGIFLIIEIATVGFLIFWLAVGALITAIFSLFVHNIIAQTTVFVLSSTLLIFATRALSKKIATKDTIPTNVYSLIGKKALVLEEINPTAGTGKIKINGEIWSATCEDHLIIAKDTEVKIIEINGVKSLVNPITEKEII